MRSPHIPIYLPIFIAACAEPEIPAPPAPEPPAPTEASTPEPPRPPEIAFSCRETTITAIRARLQDKDGCPDLDSGVTIQFKSGVVLVGYEKPLTMEHQQPGDRVQVCLVAVPHDCPPGDDRGKTYRVFDYASKEAYVMIDSDHMCGGA